MAGDLEVAVESRRAVPFMDIVVDRAAATKLISQDACHFTRTVMSE